MRYAASFVSLFLLGAVLSGCGFKGTTVPAAIPVITGNWQMQSSTGTTNAGVLLLGSLVSNGANVSGTMRFADLSLPNGCGTPLEPVGFFGNTSSSSGGQVLQLVSQPLSSGSVVKVFLTLPTVAHNLAFGSIEVDGTTCTYPASGGGIGAQIGSITGTFTGTITAPASLQSDPTGNGVASLMVTQASTAQADGQFPLTGSFTYKSGSCSDTETVTGLVSGANATLASAAVNGVSNVQITTGVNPNGEILPGFSVYFAGGACGTGLAAYSTFTGTLSQAAAKSGS